MNRYALVLPLLMLSVFFGYFGSSLQMEHVYVIATVTTVLAATSGYLLFLKQQKAGDSKRTRKTKLATAFVAVLLFSVAIGVPFVKLAAANFLPPQPSLPNIFRHKGWWDLSFGAYSASWRGLHFHREHCQLYS